MVRLAAFSPLGRNTVTYRPSIERVLLVSPDELHSWTRALHLPLGYRVLDGADRGAGDRSACRWPDYALASASSLPARVTKYLHPSACPPARPHHP